MSKFELSIASNYVPEWGVVEGVRELFQNALDEQTKKPDNEMFFDYDYETKTLVIGNKSSVLEINTLLLGNTTKLGDNETIGQFGEGYKIATLALTRLGKTVVFYNYGAREIWRPRLVRSRRYKDNVLTFFIEKKPIWDRVPDNNLTITINDIDAQEYRAICESNLHLMKPKQDMVIETPVGRILLEEKYRKNVYVNGLFVCSYKEYEYGYDFKPGHIRIDRSRKLVSDFDLRWLSSSMWKYTGGNLMLDLIKKDSVDVIYVNSVTRFDIDWDSMCDEAYDEFINEYGKEAVPVFNQNELSLVPYGYKPVIVNENYYKVLTNSQKYTGIPNAEKIDYFEKLIEWFSKIRYKCNDDEINEFEFITDKLTKEYRTND